MAGRLLVLTGPSGVGKGTVVAELRRLRPDLWVSVSATTRPPRAGEVDGVAYFFWGPERFDATIADDGFLEWAPFAGQRYGTPRAPVEHRLAAGEPVLLEIELQGARQVRAAMPAAFMVFLTPPDLTVLEDRLRGRATEDESGDHPSVGQGPRRARGCRGVRRGGRERRCGPRSPGVARLARRSGPSGLRDSRPGRPSPV